MAKAPSINTDILAPISTEAHQETIAEHQIAAIGQEYSQGRDLVNQLLGQAQAFQAAGNLLQTFGVSKLAIVKENKLYRELAGTKTPNGLELKGTWTEFCSLLGISDEKANQDIANLQAFGEDALEQMQRIGIGYRDLRQFRKLPSDQRTALIEAAREGDKDTLLELAEDLISKHVKEKTELESQLQELQADSEAKSKIIESKNSKLDDLEKTLHKMRNRTSDWTPRAFEISAEATKVAAQALESLDKLDTLRDVILTEDFGEGDHEAALEAMACVYFDAIDQVTLKAAEVMTACEQVFSGYKDRARPLINVFNPEQQAAGEAE
ncbi:hypothetical protein [Methylobacillus flagellatus]|uniref:DUF3102 domain-containing protein n=1 Tax=Methylobacillus flagellatus (strain ATCC 51484 / DSM 6875 / VKM B-1610 / KT) TaxID=265072 RepID=Q1GXQ9_METFK|nr:hypothetical protein [Methylobacillus flagellatus]ABE50978.1 conserved hypothetical protein [Methylobacillus flagellatus KT]